MPCTSAVRATGSTAMTPSSPDTSRPGWSVSALGRKRLEVRLASRTGAPGGMRWYDAVRRSTAAWWRDAPTTSAPVREAACTPPRYSSSGHHRTRLSAERSLVVEQPFLLGVADDAAHVGQPTAVVVEMTVAGGGERRAQLGAGALGDLVASRVEDGQLLLGEVVVDDLGQLLHRVVEGVGVGALELQHGEQRLVALRVLLLTVLRLVLGDGVAATQHRVDVLLLREGVRDVQRRERTAYGVAVAAAVTQLPQQALESAVVVEDQVDDVAGDGPAEVDRGAHAVSLPER